MKICTTNCKQIIDGVRKEFPYPITYDKMPAPKEEFNDNKLGNIDMLSFGSKIGYITNCSTYWWSLLYNYEKNSEKYNELIDRLKLCRKFQGAEIDSAKGIEKKDMPLRYTTYTKDMDIVDKELLADKKPYFQKYIYPKLNSEYVDFVKFRDYYSSIKYNVSWDKNEDKDFNNYMDFKNPILDNDSVVNKMCHYLEKEIKEIKIDYKKQDQYIVDDILIDTDRELLLEHEKLINELILEYKEFRERERNIVAKYSSAEEINKQIRFNNISRDIREKAYKTIKNSIDIANIVVFCGYSCNSEITKDFVWNIFGKEVFENVNRNSTNKPLYIPEKCNKEDSEFIYLGEYYKKVEVDKC